MIEQIFEGGPEQINDENVVEAFLTEIIYIRNTSCCDGMISHGRFNSDGRVVLTAANKDLICSIFVSQLRSIAFPRFLDAPWC